MAQYSVTVRNAELDAKETAIGTAPLLNLYNGTMPATCATALSGNTLLGQGTLPSDWLANASSGVKSKSGTWTITGQSGAGAGTNITFYRIYDAAGTTCHEQGTVLTNVVISTSALTAVNGNVLTFAATTGAAVGQFVTGTGIIAGTKVIAVTGTTVTLSQSSTAGVSSATSITFGGDMAIDNVNIANAQVATVSAYSTTAGNA